MPENSVDISISVPKSGHSINVFVPGSTGEVTARDNLAQTYAEWARLWAIKEGDKVNGEDYSAKYYAQQSKYSASESELNKNSCIAVAASLTNDYNNYSDELSLLFKNSLEEIESAKENALDEITTAGGGINASDFNELKENVTEIEQDVISINNEISDIKTSIKNKKEVVFSVDAENKLLIISYKENE